MQYIEFIADVWKQGNSLLVTIPKEITEIFKIEKGDKMHIEARIVDKKQIELERTINRLRQGSYCEGSGHIVHENTKTKTEENVISLDHVFVKEHKFRAGFLGEGETFDKLPLRASYDGIIVNGRILSTSFDKGHYGPKGIERMLGKFLYAKEKMNLILSDGRKITLTNIDFDPPLNSQNGLGIEMVNFHAYPEGEKSK